VAKGGTHFYYEPRIGRFLSQDPIGFLGGNLYVYVGNRPTRATDPWGLWGEDVHSGIGNTEYGTYIWARGVGFSDAEARIVAIANNATDEYANFVFAIGVPGRHFDTAIGSVDSRDLFGKYDLQLAIKLYQQGEECTAFKYLGRGLHSVQDKIAHGSWPFLVPHPAWYDDPADRPISLRVAEILTKKYLRDFLTGVSQ